MNFEDLESLKKPTAFKFQDTALRMWEKLGFNGPPPSTFFRCFKYNERKAERIVYELSDLEKADDLLKLFFWKYARD